MLLVGIDMNELQNLATYKRYLLSRVNLLAVRGNITPVISGMDVYNTRYKIDSPPGNLEPVVRDLLSVAALSAVSLSERESWGWSLNLKGMRTGFFVGLEPEGMACLRVLPADNDKVSGMVQRQKAGLPMTQSHLAPRTSSPVDVVEQYFSEVVQTETKLWIRRDGEGILAQNLPGGNFDAVRDLDKDGLFDFVETEIAQGNVKEIGEVLVFYECRCSEEMISSLVENMDESDRKHLFGDSQAIDIECPRCGREYAVTRTEKKVH
jgi:hypothetical protein